MAHVTLNHYFQQLADALSSCDGESAGELLSFKHPHVASPRLQLENPESQCERCFDPPWDELVAGHLMACYAVSNHDFIEAYRCQALVVQAFSRIFQSQKDENWALSIMFPITLDLRLFANSADVQLSKKGRGKPGETIERAAELLMGCFRVCASDNRAAPNDSKKWGMLNIVNQLFKIYFKINKLHLCKPLIRAIDALPFKDKFSLSQMITYRYYIGRKAMFEGDFKNSEMYLLFAFERCHVSAKRNKKLILIYLIPVKMLLGHMPKNSLLKKYDLLQFADVVKGVTTGNVLQLNQALEKHEAFFIKFGIYFIIEKLKINTYRTMAKKVYLMMKTHQLPIPAFTAALKTMQDDDIDDDEVECIIANLINDNKIKGYISHQHRKLVVSKANPFPLLSTIAP